ncbi:hypothetical protein [Flaviaesturariibacter aridisoli]|uniref:Uncharacterized protein n=1 Tax=Flaviaesturariibacter aridisoli TaxID=2545761 RepID=A0A4R4E5A7_9BACT|nr:hypothetical protein [Flaviaesturariibacter aridisoli]TCZ74814.1 hypothetical protein E0486_00485 [Flaviaesturariibacter aridisoli]
MKFHHLLLLLPVVSVLADCKSKECSKKISCPAYEPGVLEAWFPYNANDRLQFRNASGQVRTVTLRTEQTTGPYESRNGTDCQAVRALVSLETGARGLPLAVFSLEQLRSGTDGFRDQSVSIRMDSIHGSIYGVQDAGFAGAELGGPFTPPQTVASLTLNGQTFTNVRAFQRDTGNYHFPGFQRLFVARNKGVVAFSFYPDDSLWVLQ